LALKTYDKKNLKLGEAQQAVQSEISTLAELKHANIMRLHEVIDQRTHVHLVMELCPGMPIYHHIKKLPDQRMSENLCKTIFSQLIMAIFYMHSQGKAHRDLKLDNILFDSETKIIKVIDFGFSLEAKKE
jgi:serine/threonine protein kinase